MLTKTVGSLSVLLDQPFFHTTRRANQDPAARGSILKLEAGLQRPSATPSKRASRRRWNGDTRKSVSAIPPAIFPRPSGWQARAGRVGGVIFEGFEIPFPSITIEGDGEIKTHSLMGNVYYRYPKWRVSPYAGFGLGAFFHDGAFTSTVTVESELGTIGLPIISLPNIELPTIGFPTEPLRTTVAYEDSRFAYQIMAGLSTRVSPRVEFHFGYRFRSSRGAPIDADQIEAGIRFRF